MAHNGWSVLGASGGRVLYGGLKKPLALPQYNRILIDIIEYCRTIQDVIGQDVIFHDRASCNYSIRGQYLYKM